MSLNSFSATSFVLILCGAFAAAQENTSTEPTRIHAATEVRHRMEKGAVGSRTKKTAQVFSGQVRQAFTPEEPGVKGSAERPIPNHVPEGGQPEGATVTLKSVHRAGFEDVSPRPPGHITASQHTADLRANAYDPRAYFTSPRDGAILAPVQTFTWTQGSGVSAYGLWVGSCYDCTDIADEDEGRNTSRTLYLPNDGRTLYVTLFSLVGNNWYWVDYTFTAARPVVPAELILPTNGATLDLKQIFTWSAGYNTTGYHLQIGSCFECGDILEEDEGTNTNRTVYLPGNGQVIYVTLYSFGNDGYWYWYDYQFRATGRAGTYRIYFQNDFLYTINIFINGELMYGVEPGKTEYADLNVVPLDASFELVQPTLNGKALGDHISGYWSRIDHPGSMTLEAVTKPSSGPWFFLPQISNRTSQPLEIEVNGGYRNENRCYCDAPARTENVRAGYYDLYNNSNVRVFYPTSNYTGLYLFFGTDSDGRVSPSGQLYKLDDNKYGLVTLIVDRLP